MGNKNKYNTLYYLSIILSVSVIVFSIFCVWLFMTTVGKPKERIRKCADSQCI